MKNLKTSLVLLSILALAVVAAAPGALRHSPSPGSPSSMAGMRMSMTHSSSAVASSKAVQLRLTLDQLLGEHAILAIQATQRGYAGGADFNAVPTTPCSSCVWYFNPAAFATNDLGTFGNVGKGAYYGPSLHSWDMGLSKNFRFNGSSYVQFRFEFFNIFNMVNFDVPNNAVNNQATLGRITRTDPSSGDPRILQFALKYIF